LGGHSVDTETAWKKCGTDHFLVFSFGGVFRGMRNNALIGCISDKATTVAEIVDTLTQRK